MSFSTIAVFCILIQLRDSKNVLAYRKSLKLNPADRKPFFQIYTKNATREHKPPPNPSKDKMLNQSSHYQSHKVGENQLVFAEEEFWKTTFYDGTRCIILHKQAYKTTKRQPCVKQR